ncbi:5-carboxymethyl-2-hydroxymuconate Delta-isomerase [Aquimarina sp. TRL1]|uniref:5-carboxymethyl-2-hydroxymuconate Delta-isomerase n=1 Tax=Aquimarina sp. (strain TRL1) TaxID=2736252 RepID=UPI001588F30B|nr:5-carboxymethyl-2-hydroxymuconate Delta-isomerase [Aquimarina sp. TRL1]QKX04590.1 5-carboxymethyl-2-hydroxymuconate Delta-isomerase [Aquimarina sp. TRL1]
MPHFVIDCSKNILKSQEEETVLKEVYQVTKDSGLFDANDIKVRMRPFDTFSVGGTNTDFIHVFADIMEGRSTEQKAALSKAVVKKLKQLFPEVSFIAMNIRDFEKATYCNLGMI